MKIDPLEHAWAPTRFEYRWRCGERAGRWWLSYADAGNAAVRQGLAGKEGKRLFLGPLVSIESRVIGTATESR